MCIASSTPRSPNNTPNERIAWRSDDGPTRAGVVTFHHLGAGKTRVTAQMGILDRRAKGDMPRFKHFIENRDGDETGARRGEADRPGD